MKYSPSRILTCAVFPAALGILAIVLTAAAGPQSQPQQPTQGSVTYYAPNDPHAADGVDLSYLLRLGDNSQFISPTDAQQILNGYIAMGWGNSACRAIVTSLVAVDVAGYPIQQQLLHKYRSQSEYDEEMKEYRQDQTRFLTLVRKLLVLGACFARPAASPRSRPLRNSSQKPFACQAYWNAWFYQAAGKCVSDRNCADQAMAAAKRGLAQCNAQPPQPQPVPGPQPQFPVLGHVRPKPVPQPQPDPALKQALIFSNRMRQFAEIILQAAGQMSKAMTDATDVTKHNNVGVGVAIGGAFGAAGKMMGVVAGQYQALAAAGRAAQQEGAVLQIAKTAASESQTMAAQAEQTVAKIDAAGPATAGANTASAGYLEDITLLSTAQKGELIQGELPTCTVLSCFRLSQLLGRNATVMQVFDRIRPEIQTAIDQSGNVTVKGGLTLPEVSTALQGIGIQAQVESGLPGVVKAVGAGRPVIAGVFTMGASFGGPQTLHAVVVEGLKTRGLTVGLKIYDPVGFVYWQPLSTFGKFFTGQFVKPI